MLLLSYPLARWQVVVGKVLGQTVILGGATLVGYGAAAAALACRPRSRPRPGSPIRA
jgi:Cu-processing system permease protein